MRSINVLAVASAEFREAFRWYRGRSLMVGRRFALEVKSAIASIHAHPDQQLRWDNVYGFRMLDKFPYFVAFRESADEVVIVAVRHTSRDQDAWQGR
jgi:plasmid stabilization system protein ParE